MNIKHNIYGLNNPLQSQAKSLVLQKFEKNTNFDVLIGE